MSIVYNNIAISAHLNWPVDGFVEFTIVDGDDITRIVEALDYNLCLSNTREHEPGNLEHLLSLFGDEGTLLYLMHEARGTSWTECPHCGDDHQPYNDDCGHNCSEHWVPAEWSAVAYAFNTSESVLRAIVEVTGCAFSCPDSDFRSAADIEWAEGNRSEEVLRRAFELEGSNVVYWGGENKKPA